LKERKVRNGPKYNVITGKNKKKKTVQPHALGKALAPLANAARSPRLSSCFASAIHRGENGRKRSVNTKTIFIFIFFLGNEIENGNSGNENNIGNSETSETKVRHEN
jgi:hypothetical protein